MNSSGSLSYLKTFSHIYIEEQAAQYRDIGMTEDDRIIGLSTCAEAETNGRVIVFGRLDPMNEIQEGGA